MTLPTPREHGPTEPSLPTRAWTQGELEALDRTPLIRLRLTRVDGTIRDPVPIGHVRLGVDEIIRSLRGPSGAWYQQALRRGYGEIETDAGRTQVAFFQDVGREDEIDRALRRRYGEDSGVQQMTSAVAREANLRMEPLA